MLKKTSEKPVKKTGKQIWELVSQHLGYVFECYCAFEDFMGLLLDEGKPAAELWDGYAKIDKLEGLADDARRNLIQAFLEGSLLPSTRKELMDIVARMDKVANRCQNIACQVVCQNVYIPPQFRQSLMDIVRVTKEQYLVMKKALKVLFDDYDQLIKNSSLLDAINAKEGEVDKIEDNITISIFSDPDLILAEKHHLRYFVTRLSDISDLLEDIADHIQIIVVLRKV